MPAQQGPRGDGQAQLTELAAGQQPGQRGQDRPVSPRQPRFLHLALEDGNLVAQDEDPGILGTVRTGGQGKPAGYADHRPVCDPEGHGYRQCPAMRTPRSLVAGGPIESVRAHVVAELAVDAGAGYATTALAVLDPIAGAAIAAGLMGTWHARS